MKSIIVLLLMLGSFASGSREPLLPSWESEEREKMLEDGWVAGGSLLNFETPLGDESSDRRVLGKLEGAPAETDEMENPENVVKEEFLAGYFAERPSHFLVDPQGFLGTRERKDLEAFLEDHAGESSIDMFVYVFGGEQEIPSDVREEEVVERLYSVGKPAVVIYYYLGAPQRATTYLSPIITDVVSAAEQRRALESSVIRSFGSADESGQLESFLVQMSIRIYWMERMTEGTAVETKEEISEEDSVAKLAEKPETKIREAFVLPSWLRIAGGGAVAGAGLLLFLWSGFVWMKERARFRFPEFEIEPRLGASHAAGIGAVISFSSSSIPPASQRDQVPDYLRRA
ncbi:MAG: hypothetical protein AB8D78_07480 [Akkermansiaceae bacterium]